VRAPCTALAGALAALALCAPTVAGAQTTTTAAPATPEVTAAQAGPGLLLAAEDRVELASALADATEDTGVCFGYSVSVGGGGASNAGTETLSSAGPGVSAEEAAAGSAAPCPKGTLEVVAYLSYTSSSSEAEDSASYSVRSTVAGLAGISARSQLEDLTGLSEGGLLGDDDDLVLRNATAALPLLVGGSTPAPVATGTAAPNGDRLTGSPGSDWVRKNGLGVGIAVVLLIVALVLVAGGLTGRRQSRKPKRPTGSTGSGPSSPTPTKTP
jgi:hypothetical protein